MTTGWDSELQRVAAVRALRLLDTPREERFDRITRVARHVFGVPIALVTLVDLDRQWFKSCIGLEGDETPREVSFCTHAVAAEELLEVPDARDDPRFYDNPSVVGEPHIRFYAGQPLRSSSGHYVGTLCVVDDVPRTLTDAQRRQLKDLAAWVELECAVVQASAYEKEVEKARRDFVSVVSHELRTPLTSIHGALELAVSGRFGDLPPQLSRLVGIASKNTDRLVRMVSDVLDLDRIHRGAMKLRLAPVKLPEVVTSAVDSVAASVPVHTRCPAELEVHGDADRLVQVLTNLVANAVKVSPTGAPVDIACEPEGRWAKITVRDRGPGVPPDRAAEIFEPFVQLDLPNQQTGGAGLGLAITRGIVEAHGGRIAVHSAPGGGSEFEVAIPAAGPGSDQAWW